MTGAAPAAGPTMSVAHAAREIARDIKLTHSVFALPFAALGAVYAAVYAAAHTATHAPGAADAATAAARRGMDWRAFAVDAALVVACMVCARTAAMIANRLLDRELDARNPRTAGRAIPAGRLSVRAAAAGYALAGIGFVGCAALFGVLHGNWWPLALAVPVLAWISAYGLFKRFTALCHVWLGASLAISPPAAALAVNPDALASAAPWLMSGMVLCWVAGFDIIYALQDVAVDQRDGLHSMPSRLGARRAMWVSRALHAAALGFLVALWSAVPEFGALFGAAVALVAVLLVVEHATVHRWGTSRIAATFTTVNGAVSVAVGAAGVASLLQAAS
ncbi:MAG: 4-hydroxybenzoate octaprenyltransferase [Phycisphaerae bacterium]|nr:4-hydroxybenzoate octaprenyltransferase [Phycisphaerae bacterium]